MKGVIYARYSSDNQREESIEGQLRECKAFAEKNDIQIVETYIDRALSARTDRRPDFQRMIKDSAGKKFEVVIVWKLDRFARDKYDSAHYKRILKNNGIKVVSATEAISAGAEGILLESMREGMAANKKAPAKHKAEDEYLLTTKLFCGKCQCYMVGESGTGRNKVHRYYKCASVKNHKGCDKKTVKKEWIENLVIEQIKKLIFDDELIEKLADTVMKLQSKENTALPLLKKRFADTQKSIDNMLDTIQQGILTASTKERLESLGKQKSGAMFGLTKSLAQFGSKYGIRCVCVFPHCVQLRTAFPSLIHLEILPFCSYFR